MFSLVIRRCVVRSRRSVNERRTSGFTGKGVFLKCFGGLAQSPAISPSVCSRTNTGQPRAARSDLQQRGSPGERLPSNSRAPPLLAQLSCSAVGPPGVRALRQSGQSCHYLLCQGGWPIASRNGTFTHTVVVPDSVLQLVRPWNKSRTTENHRATEDCLDDGPTSWVYARIPFSMALTTAFLTGIIPATSTPSTTMCTHEARISPVKF